MALRAKFHLVPEKGYLTATHPVGADVLFYRGTTCRVAPPKYHAFDPPDTLRQLRGPARDIPPHDHGLYEVALICGGSAVHITEHEERRAIPGNVIIASPGAVHAYEQLDELVVVNLSYLTEWLADDLPVLWEEPALLPLFLGKFLFPQSTAESVVQLELRASHFQLCLDELRILGQEVQAEAPSLLMLRLCLIKILVLVGRVYVHLHPEGAPERHRPEVWALLDLVERSVLRSERPSVEELARQFGLTHDHLGYLFRAAVGTSIREYHQRRRAHQAANLLRQPGTRVTDVAHSMGFADASHFSRLFRRYFGETPKQYQKRATCGKGLDPYEQTGWKRVERVSEPLLPPRATR
jgi:AraC-like DNA-binding protein